MAPRSTRNTAVLDMKKVMPLFSFNLPALLVPGSFLTASIQQLCEQHNNHVWFTHVSASQGSLRKSANKKGMKELQVLFWHESIDQPVFKAFVPLHECWSP